jgi:four helix bundle protein
VGTVERFEQLIAWQKAREFAHSVYQASERQLFRRDTVLTFQIRKSVISIASNIAEGFERGGRAEFAQFLSVAKASCAEVRTQLYIAYDIGYVDDRTFNELMSRGEELAKVIGGLRVAVSRQRKSNSVLSPQSSVLPRSGR